MSNVSHEGINICNEVCGVIIGGRGGTLLWVLYI